MKASTRIDALRELIPAGARVADVGTDRALLPRLLLARCRTGHCVAIERDDPRVERARLASWDLREDPRLELRAGDGLEAIEPGDRIDVAVIAGLGGPSVRRILERGRPAELGIRRLVLQPQTALGEVRAWLAANGFRIVEERLVVEGARFFTIVAAESGLPAAGSGPRGRLAEEDLLEIGPRLAESGDPLVAAYWKQELARLDRIVAAAGEGAGRGRRDAHRRRELARRAIAALDAASSAGGALRELARPGIDQDPVPRLHE